MITLHYSNRLEELIEPLASRLAQARAHDPFETGVIVVPNRVYAQFLKLRLAEISGIAANLSFPFLRRYLADLVTAADPQVRVLEADELQLALFEWLRAAIAREPALGPLAAYAASAAGDERELAHFQLSARVARLLREYSTSRPAMMREWRRGVDLAGVDPTVQSWQRTVYQALFDNNGRLRQGAAGPRALFLPDAMAALDDQRLAAAMPPSLHLFGLAYVAPEFVRIFARLGQVTDLHLYALNPCLEFWEDVPAGMLSGPDKRLVSRRQRVDPGVLEAEDPFAIEAEENPALVLWSRPGREYLRLLNELTQGDFQAHFVPPMRHDGGSLLARLQEAILLRQRALPQPASKSDDDRSLRLFACPDVRGEVESIANAIWSMVGAGASQPPLRFHEIGILLPDGALATYLPQFQAVFAELHAIPLHIAGLLGGDDPVAEAIELLLRLPLGPLGRDEVLHLLTHPALGGAEGAGCEEWQSWCEALGIYFGADERDLAATYIPPANYHWDQGLRRLALGAFLTGKSQGEEQVFRAADQRAYAALAIDQGQVEGAANLLRQARGLLAAALELRQARLPLPQWAQALRRFVQNFLKPGDPAGERTLATSLAAIAAMAPRSAQGEPVGYRTACELALQVVAQVHAEAGGFAQSGVALGSMAALRSLPFRVLFVAGLGEGQFPARENADPFDLRAARRQVGDVSPNQRDRYLFLEALLAARQRLILSYVARDEMTGVKLQPSPLVSELGFVLGAELGEAGLAAITIEYPVANYDRAYFPDLGGAGVRESPSHSFTAHRAARLAALREHLREHCGGRISAPLPALLAAMAPAVRAKLEQMLEIARRPAAPVAGGEDNAVVLPLSALRSFLFCPLQGTARYRLGMRDEEGDQDREDAMDEPLQASFLDRLMLTRNAFWEGRGQAQQVAAQANLRLDRQSLEGQTPAGPFLDALRSQSQARLTNLIAQAQALGLARDMSQWRQLRFGAGEEFEVADETLAPIELEVAGIGGPLKIGLRATIRVSAELASSYCVTAAKEPRPKDFVEGALSAIALAAANQPVARRFNIIAVGFDEEQKPVNRRRVIAVPDPRAAREYLSALVYDLLFGDEHYFFPIEAVAKIAGRNELKPAEMVEVVEELRQHDGDRERLSSDYGPLRDAREFPPPPAAAIRRLIQRRFGPLLAIFAKGEEAEE